VSIPNKLYGPESNDLALQLRKHGFEVAVVKDATAGAILPGMNAYEAALINFRMIASHVFTTE
jgi:nicotinamidase-related amidase